MTITLTPVEQGAGIGAALGLGASLLFLRKPSKTEYIASTLLGAAAGAVVAQVRNAGSAAALTPAPVNLTVSPPGTYSITPVIGQTVNIALPAGASWTSNNGSPLSGNAPISWVYQGPGTVTLTWTDAAGAAHTTVFSFSTSSM